MPPSAEPGDVEHLATRHYFDRVFENEAVKVLPGEYYVTADNLVLVTVLGSCVSACVRDSVLGIGGMNHFMLPEGDREEALISSSARYGAYAMEVLINHLLKSGARRERLEAKVFGGGHVLDTLASSTVGARNADFVLGYLGTEGIPVVAQNLGDRFPRKVYYFPRSGRVMMRKLLGGRALVLREKAYQARLRQDQVAGDVELFG